MSGAHGHVEGSNKRIALLIAVFALLLAIAETMAKSAQTDAINSNVEASNLWAFFQARTIRQTVVRTAGEELTFTRDATPEGPVREALTRQIAAWRATADRWESEPATGEGRKELTERARKAEAKRDKSYKRYHDFEIASAGFQIAIVLASATVITGAVSLAWIAGALGIVGLGFTAIGLFSPGLIHLF
ncbi:MAG: DUF4337 domain-containing protein [Hyphomicrobiales bacterium]|jgi:hypothetical protein|nr:DUF4337 domain-containing protein [Hyphomicrobiales bacterium]